jgi:beta-glucosidase
MNLELPDDFLWGAATAAYQVEGAVKADGRGESIWDRFAATPGKVRNGETGEVACDFYRRYPEDIALMKELGLGAFRFSIAWPRVLPDGRGRVNQAGLDFYDRLVDALLDAGIRPFATLYHWDLPQALEDAGGWPVRETAQAFVDYVEAVANRLGDRVTDWTTHNEPFCSSWLGYGHGVHAPGRSSAADALAAAHHVLLSHGWAVDVLRRECPRAEVGIVLDSWPAHPASDDDADREAAQIADGVRNRWFFDPVLRGRYPVDTLEHFEPLSPPVEDGDLAAIAVPVDFVGVNNYSRTLVRADPAGGAPLEVRSPTAQLTDMGWEIYPDGLAEVLRRLHDDYAAPSLYVTENGAAFADVRTHDGRIHDNERCEYLTAYIEAVSRTIARGVPVRGYFAWSLLDNFEWAYGYSKRFGLVYVDYPTLERVPKDSFYRYRDLISGRHGSAPRVRAGVERRLT